MTGVGTRSFRHPPLPSTEAPRVALPAGPPWFIARALIHGVTMIVLLLLVGTLSVVVVPRFVGYPTLTVQGGSMGDSIPRGSLVIGRWIAPEEVRLNDVILVQEKQDGVARSPKIHRVVSLDEEDGRILVQTKGDANDSVDPGLYVLPDRVAVHARTAPYVGYVVDFVRTPIGWTIFVALPAIVLCAFTLRDIWGPLAKTASPADRS